MRIIICGMGQVGRSIAAYLSKEENDVTVIDDKEDYIAQIRDTLDVNAIVGHAADPEILNAAGAKDADMIIAVTKWDEVNMVACQIGHSLFGIPKKSRESASSAISIPRGRISLAGPTCRLT